MKTARKNLGLASVFAIAFGPSAELNSHLNRFLEMTRASQAEDRFVTELAQTRQLRVALPAQKPESLRDPRALTASQRLEWSLREGAAPAGTSLKLGLEELRPATSSSLLDAGMWAHLRARVPNLFATDAPWASVRKEFGRFLDSLDSSALRGLFAQEHGDWWKWLMNEGAEGLEDPVVKSFTRFESARRGKGESRALLYLEARSYLQRDSVAPKDLSDLDVRMFHLLRAEYADLPRMHDILERTPTSEFKFQKIEALAAMSRLWKDQSRPEMAADALERIEHLRSSHSGDDTASLLTLAQLQLQGKLFDKAIETFQRILASPADPVAQTQARGGLALASEKRAEMMSGEEAKQAWEWAAEFYRRASRFDLLSENRDQILEGYARVLEKLGYWEAAVEAADALYRYGSRKESRSQGIRTKVAMLERDLKRRLAAARPDMKARSLFVDWVQSLGTWSRIEAKSPQIAGSFKDARALMGPLEYERDAMLTATLGEIEQRIGAEPRKP